MIGCGCWCRTTGSGCRRTGGIKYLEFSSGSPPAMKAPASDWQWSRKGSNAWAGALASSPRKGWEARSGWNSKRRPSQRFIAQAQGFGGGQDHDEGGMVFHKFLGEHVLVLRGKEAELFREFARGPETGRDRQQDARGTESPGSECRDYRSAALDRRRQQQEPQRRDPAIAHRAI